ncbi:MAG: hypothetical protein JWP87_3710 [Labilithrix sp.]|nr:hypothetical protein [Labilithrix sp.]
MSAVDAVAIESVLEAEAECSDLDRARAALSEALIAARAPARGGSRLRGARPTSPPPESGLAHWTLTMTVTAAAPSASTRAVPIKSVDALIVDDAGTIVAQRTLTDRSARTCVPLARAVGAWASLVLDAELLRAKDDDGAPPALATSAATATTRSAAASSTTPWPRLGLDRPRSAAPRDTSTPTGADGETPEEKRALEVGSMVYIRNGMTATGGFAGVSPFVSIEVAEGWVLRPSLAFGRSTEGAQPTSHVGARGDFCRRIPGNYIERRGIEADLCAGLEGGVVTSQSASGMRGDAVGRVGLGPSANLRGELAYGLALEVRGLVGANLSQSPLAEHSAPPLVFAAAELGISVRLR